MSNKVSEPMSFWDLDDDERDLTMFTITNLTLIRNENANMVYMALKLKRKVSTELVTTYPPPFSCSSSPSQPFSLTSLATPLL